jgi:hypothetical protein
MSGTVTTTSRGVPGPLHGDRIFTSDREKYTSAYVCLFQVSIQATGRAFA